MVLEPIVPVYSNCLLSTSLNRGLHYTALLQTWSCTHGSTFIKPWHQRVIAPQCESFCVGMKKAQSPERVFFTPTFPITECFELNKGCNTGFLLEETSVGVHFLMIKSLITVSMLMCKHIFVFNEGTRRVPTFQQTASFAKLPILKC